MTSDSFQKLYSQLNAEQKTAVDEIEGPVMVVAGPGTGKTQILTLRIANILLKTQMNPGNILALTFTESGAGEMRRRLYEIIGAAAYQVNIFTFHGFCNDTIQNYPEDFSEIIGRKPANEIEQIDLIKNSISGSKLKLLKPFGEPFFYLRDSRRATSNLKREGISPEDLLKILEKQKDEFEKIDDLYYDSGRYRSKMKGKYADAQRQIEKNLELAQIYQKYQDGLAEAKLYDYDDMILQVAQTLGENGDLLLRLQEKFQYFLVDEHQDTNNAQNKVLELLCNFYDKPNLFVVGDEKQAIFRFQGASLENFLYFKKLYLSAKLIVLEKNYRSSQSILDLATSFITKNSRKISDIISEIGDGLSAHSGHPERIVEFFEFKRPEAESYFLSQKISELIKDGAPAKEIAVIFRDNKDAADISEMLEKRGIPFRIESGRNILEDQEISKLVSVLRFLDDFPSEERLFEILNVDIFDISSLDIYRLNPYNSKRDETLLTRMADIDRLKSLGVESPEKIIVLAEKLSRWHKISKNENLLQLFEKIVRESGYLDHILAEEKSAGHLARLSSLFFEIKKLLDAHPDFKLADFINYLDALAKHGLVIKETKGSYIPNAVRLMTAHGAKGLEFDHVFIVNAFDGHWGNRRVPQLIKLPRLFEGGRRPDEAGDSAKIDDERRLFYVAVTRARKMVYISYSSSGIDGREQLPSQFVEEIKPELKKSGDAEKYEKDFEKDQTVLFAPRTESGFSIFEKEYLNDLFFKRGLSATGLNNFLSCPWKYFYLNLIRIPRAKSRHQMFGSAVHAALKDFFDGLRSDGATKEFLLARFEEALKREPLIEKDFEIALEKGRESLSKYHEHYSGSWITDVRTEFRVNSVFLKQKNGGGDIKLTGALDKIENLDGDKEVNPAPRVYNHGLPWCGVNVVDYKTGQSKTRNEIEGKTKSGTGDYIRQLVFYKLLLDEYKIAGVDMISGEIDFVEPDKKGKFHKEKFYVSKEQVDELHRLIQEVSGKIINLSFVNERCDDRECEFCRLRTASAR